MMLEPGTALNRIAALMITALLLLPLWQCGRSDTSGEDHTDALAAISAPWTGDLDEIIAQKRFIRALVSYNQTNFFIDKGQPRGIEYELLKAYENYLNRQQKRKGVKIKVVFTVLPFEGLLPALAEGRGDLVAAGLTITPGRAQGYAFTTPYIKDVKEVVVTHQDDKTFSSVTDLSGRKVHVMSGSSYAAHLARINLTFIKSFRPPIRIVEVDPHLEEEDLMQMVNAGIYDITVVDNHIADIWSRVLDHIKVQPNVTINDNGRIAWAVRKTDTQLLSSLDDFFRTHSQGSLMGNMLIKRYYEDTQWIKNPLARAHRDKIEEYKVLFQKYARRYNFDWLKVAALAYQESGLNQQIKSHRGAVGIMQVLPSTARGKNIAIADIKTSVENNIHAGVKYLAYLRDTYFNEPEILPEDRADFAIAAYNAGPARINQIRKKAAKMGLDPNRWFSNVEYAARKYIGREPVQYVSNIYIYYIAYRSAFRVVKSKPDSAVLEEQKNRVLLK